MDSSNKEKRSNSSGSSFYTVDAVPLYQTSKKPFHLEERFNRALNLSSDSARHQKPVKTKRETILEEQRKKSNQHSLKIKRIAKEARDRRESKIVHLSKSMEAAELNRNLYIERRKAQSKNIVERAKQIALQNQHRSLQEQERRRAELEKRLERTEARRLAHLNRYKKRMKKKSIPSSSSPSTVNLLQSVSSTDMPISSTTKKSTAPPPLSPSLIAPKKKPSSWSIILKAFRELGLPSPSSPETWLEFNTLSQLLHQAKVIVVTTKILNTALKLKDEESRHRARVLLTSYMMLMCPKEVLQDINGDEEKRLHAAAKQMLQLFEIWLRAHGRPGATAARLAFVEGWNDYNLLFESWKSRDCEQLISNMIKYYVELSTLRQTVIAQQSGEEAVGEQLQQQLDEIKNKLQRLGGTNVLERLQRALEASSGSTSTGRRQQQRINTPRSPILDNDEDEKTQTNPSRASPEQLGQLLSSYTHPSSGLTNEQLAHELIMDPEFKFKRYMPMNDLERRVKLMAEKAFFDKLAEDMEQGKSDDSIASLIKETKMHLLSLVRPGTLIYSKINETLDMTLIKQQMKQKIFDIDVVIHYVLEVMTKLCAPIRDDDIKKVQESQTTESMIEQFKRIFDILEDMSLDLANFRLRSLRPHLMTIAVEYERDKFAEMLNNGTIQLVRTERWLKQSTDRICQAATQRHPEHVQTLPSADAVFEDAFVSLLSQTKPIANDDDLPETLRLDAHRMAGFQNQLQAVSIVAALVMLARNFGSTSPQALPDLASRLFTMLEDTSTTIDHLAEEIIRSANVRPERCEMVRTMVDKTVSHNDTVYSLISRRVASIIKSTLQNNRFVADAVLSGNGLEHVKSQLQTTAIQIQRLVYHHRRVYGSWYHQIIKDSFE